MIAGTLDIDGAQTRGAIQGGTTAPVYLDVDLPAGARWSMPINPEHNVFVYPFEGAYLGRTRRFGENG